MRDQDLPSREPATPPEPVEGEPAFVEGADRPESRGRRQFLKTAARTGAPVILTVASRPAWGTPHFCTPSGWCSGASVPQERWAECATGGLGPDAWDAPWPTGADDYFGPDGWNGNAQQTPVFDAGPHDKIKAIIKDSSGDYSAMGIQGDFLRAAAAAYLNALADPTHHPTVSTLQCIVRDMLGTGTYITTGCSWDFYEAVDYLQSTFEMG